MFFVAPVRLLPNDVFASAFPRTGRPLLLTDVCESACKGTKNGDYKAVKPSLFLWFMPLSFVRIMEKTLQKIETSLTETPYFQSRVARQGTPSYPTTTAKSLEKAHHSVRKTTGFLE